MKRWNEFAAESPAVAEAGRALIYQFRVGLGYLATIRKDGGPRVHPVCPVIANGGLYVFIGNQSPKLHDLLRDGRFALHSFPNPEVDDEFYVSGRVSRVTDAETRRTVYEAYTATGAFTSDDTLFELLLERALHAKYGARPSWPPVYTKWLADEATA
jgi:Pyridoxamine 5'-phosphate oxidase